MRFLGFPVTRPLTSECTECSILVQGMSRGGNEEQWETEKTIERDFRGLNWHRMGPSGDEMRSDSGGDYLGGFCSVVVMDGKLFQVDDTCDKLTTERGKVGPLFDRFLDTLLPALSSSSRVPRHYHHLFDVPV